MPSDSTGNGWTVVADTEGSARLIGALADLDDGGTYTRTELAEMADVPLKTLYLDDTVETCADLGLFDRVEADDESEAVYRVNPTSDALAAAAQFDAAIRRASEGNGSSTDEEAELPGTT